MLNKKKYNVIIASCISFFMIAFIVNDVSAVGITAPVGTGLVEGVGGSNAISNIIQKVIKWLAGIIGGLSILMIVVGGIMYITSGGDSTKTETAKNIIIYSIVGLVISLLAWIIVNVVIKTIG